MGPPVTIRSSVSTQVNTVSAAIAVIAALLKVPATAAVAITAGTFVFQNNVKEVYYIYTYKVRTNASTMKMQTQRTTEMYRYSNYTGFIDSYTDTVTENIVN